MCVVRVRDPRPCPGKSLTCMESTDVHPFVHVHEKLFIHEIGCPSICKWLQGYGHGRGPRTRTTHEVMASFFHKSAELEPRLVEVWVCVGADTVYFKDDTGDGMMLGWGTGVT